MKAALIAVLCACGLFASQAAQVREVMSPVSRVVKLLNGLAEQIEKDGKKEEDLYETFVCWGKSVVQQKTDSNVKAEARIDALKTYIADLDAGKIELTTERQDLEKEVEELGADLAALKSTRDKEKKDFEGAEEEMKAAVKALDSAIKVLDEATKDNKKGALLAFHAQLNGGVAALEAESANLDAAAALGERFLSKADSTFLRRVLTGDVPERDEKMLRKKADFKKSYKTRSGNIQDVLKRLQVTFSNNLKEAQDKETESQAAYDKLSGAKQEQFDKSSTALKDLVVENGARGLTKEQSQDEIDALQENVDNDKRFITQTENSLTEKEGEWEDRSKLRENELTAISKAISILHSDDARDNFKKSFASQEGFFLQVDSQSTILANTVTQLKQIVRKTGDRRLSALAALIAEAKPQEKFGPVIDAIDKMITTLKADEKTDLETKESCEKDRMDTTRKALLAGREIDDHTDHIVKLESEIKELEESIKKLLEEKKEVQKELDKATEIRGEEKALWVVTDKEDADAASTVKDATDVLKGFYALVQKSHHAIPKVVAGEAPPPPAATWDAPLEPKKGESAGIIGILEMIFEDIEKDQAKAKAEEDKAEKEFEDMKTAAEKEMEDLQTEADKQTGIKGDKELEKSTAIGDRKDKKGEWDGIMKMMQDTAPNCEYYAVNYKMRRSNRALEIDGLNNAKAILKGGSFK